MLQPPGELDRGVQDPLEGFVGGARVESAILDPVAQAATGDVLGEHNGPPVESADVVTAADVRMQPQRNPCLGLVDESLALAGAWQGARVRTLHRQVDAPLQVPDLVDLPHAALTGEPQHLVPAVDDGSHLQEPRPRGRAERIVERIVHGDQPTSPISGPVPTID